MREGMLWQVQQNTQSELLLALEWAKMKHGDQVTGKVFAHNADLARVEADSSITPGCWLVELLDHQSEKR